MSTKIRIEFDDAGFQALFNSPEVKKMLEKRANAVAAAAGEGFEAKEFKANYGGSPRPAYMVATESWEARRAQATGNVLEAALYSG